MLVAVRLDVPDPLSVSVCEASVAPTISVCDVSVVLAMHSGTGIALLIDVVGIGDAQVNNSVPVDPLDPLASGVYPKETCFVAVPPTFPRCKPFPNFTVPLVVWTIHSVNAAMSVSVVAVTVVSLPATRTGCEKLTLVGCL